MASKQSSNDAMWLCDGCMVKNKMTAKICVCCESPQPGCEEEAKAAKAQAKAAKEAEMKARMDEDAKSVAAAGITFGLPTGGAKPGGGGPAGAAAPGGSRSGGCWLGVQSISAR